MENETSVTTGRTVTPSTKMEIWGRQGNEFYYISDTYQTNDAIKQAIGYMNMEVRGQVQEEYANVEGLSMVRKCLLIKLKAS